MSALYSLRDVSMRYTGGDVLTGITVEFGARQFVTILGPNGAGKSTLLSIMAGLRQQSSGKCLYAGTDVHKFSRRAFTRRVSFVPQTLRMEFPFTSEQVVMMGRTPYCDGLFEAPEDREEVERVMEITDTLPFRNRDFRSLSGGERQRVILASALAHKPETLLLDEPTTFLDLKHQVSVYRLLRDLAREGLLVIAVTHDLNLASAFADRLVVLDDGRIAADSTPADVLGRDLVRRVFDVDVNIAQSPGGKPWILYGE